MIKILIATTNIGKFKEIVSEFHDLPYKFTNLKKNELFRPALPEPYDTTWENALHKAKFYAIKSGLLTIAEDTGLFIKHLNGEPGVNVKRSAATPNQSVRKIMRQLKGVPINRRHAFMQCSACIYDPKTNNFNIFNAKVNGIISQTISGKTRSGMEHDAIFYYPPAKKLFSALSIAQKNLISHRGQIIVQLRNYLNRQYGLKQFIVPLAVLVKNKKILLLKRRDPRSAFNNQWEFPGGGVEDSETITNCLIREVKEETGFKAKIICQLNGVYTTTRSRKEGYYQVFLVPYLCSVNGGVFKTRDSETAGFRWATLAEILKAKLLPLNHKMILDNLKLIKSKIF